MRKVSWLITLSGLLALVPCASGANLPATLTGAWKGAFGIKGGTVWVTIHLTDPGDALTGTIDGLPTPPAKIQGGRIDGHQISFWAMTDYQGHPFKVVFKGRYVSRDRQIHLHLSTDHGKWTSTLVLRKIGSPGANTR